MGLSADFARELAKQEVFHHPVPVLSHGRLKGLMVGREAMNDLRSIYCTSKNSKMVEKALSSVVALRITLAHLIFSSKSSKFLSNGT